MAAADKIAEDIKQALKSGDKTRLSVLRMIKSIMKNLEIDKKRALSDDEVQSIIGSYAKKLKESIEQFEKAGRTDLVAKESSELEIISGYLPAQLGEDDLREMIEDIVKESGASGPAGIGKVMKAAMAKVKGQADGRLVNKIVKEALEA